MWKVARLLSTIGAILTVACGTSDEVESSDVIVRDGAGIQIAEPSPSHLEVVETETGGDCRRAEAETFDIGAIIRIGEVEPPCRVEFRETGIVLRGDPSGSRPDPGGHVVRDRQGRYYTANATGFPSVLSLWSAEGEYLKSFSGPGDGPGELANGSVSMHVDRSNRLHVRDGGGRWSIFNEGQEFVTSIRAGFGTSWAVAFLDGGSVITSALVPRDYYFSIVDSTGATVRTFGPVDPLQSAETRSLDGRSIASSGSERFWAAPPSSGGYNPVGYRLEEWSTNGELLRTIERDATWFPRNWPPPSTRPEGGLLPSRPIQIADLHLDDSGLLFVTVIRESSAWRPLSLQAYSQLSIEESAEMYERRLEIIDTLAGSLLVSQVLHYGEYPAGEFIPGTRSVGETELGDDLIQVVKVWDFRLVNSN